MTLSRVRNRVLMNPAAIGNNTALSIALTTAGRVGFYIDYSELSAAGTHTFYVARTHGTAGAVSVDYATSGDTHTSVSGTLNWADGQADIQSIEVPVSAGNLSTHASSGLGEHRIVMTLSSATGGAVLHRESTSGNFTRAYGIVDSATMIASDANAYFCDWDAGSDGSGTLASPYNSWASVRSAQNTTHKRYIYGKGTFVVGVNSPAADIVNSAKVIDMDKSGNDMSGNSDTDRTFIMAWPAFTWTVTRDGSDTVTSGNFYSDNDDHADYMTFKNIDFDDLNSTGGTTGSKVGGFWFRANSRGYTVERCSMTNSTSGANSAVAGVYDEGAGHGGNVYRCTFVNLKKSNGIVLQCIECYKGHGRSWTSNTCNDHKMYQKGAPDQTQPIATTMKFNTFDGGLMEYGVTGGSDYDYIIVQGNLFENFANNVLILSNQVSDKVWIAGNVFSNCGATSTGNFPVDIVNTANDQIYFNNVWLDCTRTIRNRVAAPEFFDYNHYFGGDASWRMANDSDIHETFASLQGAGNYEQNGAESDPDFDANFAPNIGSPILTSGLTSSEKGLYLTGAEVIGA